jgi:hypothetical protein
MNDSGKPRLVASRRRPIDEGHDSTFRHHTRPSVNQTARNRAVLLRIQVRWVEMVKLRRPGNDRLKSGQQVSHEVLASNANHTQLLLA